MRYEQQANNILTISIRHLSLYMAAEYRLEEVELMSPTFDSSSLLALTRMRARVNVV